MTSQHMRLISLNVGLPRSIEHVNFAGDMRRLDLHILHSLLSAGRMDVGKRDNTCKGNESSHGCLQYLDK